MTVSDVITAWKEPMVRDGLADQDAIVLPQHPAGRSPFERDPANCAGGMLPATIQTIGPVTSFLSCTLACSQTLWDGSCDFFTYGCCV
jgi:mersacidin/lichenicidin family type 2 lantibiotic